MFYTLISSNTALRYMFAEGREAGRTCADHYYVTPSLRGGQKGYTGLDKQKDCVSTNLWNFYTNNRLFIPLQYATWLKYLRRSPIWYTYLVKGTCICRAMEHGILE
jgi:hypothetical protein